MNCNWRTGNFVVVYVLHCFCTLHCYIRTVSHGKLWSLSLRNAKLKNFLLIPVEYPQDFLKAMLVRHPGIFNVHKHVLHEMLVIHLIQWLNAEPVILRLRSSSAACASCLVCCLCRFNYLVWHGIFLPSSTFIADSLMVFAQPPGAVARFTICTHVPNPKH